MPALQKDEHAVRNVGDKKCGAQVLGKLVIRLLMIETHEFALEIAPYRCNSGRTVGSNGTQAGESALAKQVAMLGGNSVTSESPSFHWSKHDEKLLT